MMSRRPELQPRSVISAELSCYFGNGHTLSKAFSLRQERFRAPSRRHSLPGVAAPWDFPRKACKLLMLL